MLIGDTFTVSVLLGDSILCRYYRDIGNRGSVAISWRVITR